MLRERFVEYRPPQPTRPVFDERPTSEFRPTPLAEIFGEAEREIPSPPPGWEYARTPMDSMLGERRVRRHQINGFIKPIGADESQAQLHPELRQEYLDQHTLTLANAPGWVVGKAPSLESARGWVGAACRWQNDDE